MRITKPLLAWYDQNRRSLPWREHSDPYRIWLSEVMLQQTRVETVLPRYIRFLDRYPCMKALADAPLEEVYKEWEGLGYYSRARNLHAAARRMVDEGIPNTYAGWKGLPGVGEYTAGAVASICFGEPVAAVDGNALRVFARLLAIRMPVRQPEARRTIEEAIQHSLSRERPGDLNQAIMDLGAMICRPRQPLCEECPLKDCCNARKAGEEDELPVKAIRSEKRVETLYVQVILRKDETVLVRKRPEGGLLGGMWEFPHQPQGSRRSVLGRSAHRVMALPSASHTFTHRIWRMEGGLYRANVDVYDAPDGCVWATQEELRLLPIPSAMAHWRRIAVERLTGEGGSDHATE